MSTHKKIDPTYFRFVYDQLANGYLDPQNESSLPRGVTGIYEKQINSIRPFYKRQQVLEVLSVFAIAQQPISKELASTIVYSFNNANTHVDSGEVGRPEVNLAVFEFVSHIISDFSSWFNTDNEGRLYLAHERIKVYLLQKLSDYELFKINEAYVVALREQWKELNVDSDLSIIKSEIINYSLHYLPAHLYFSGIIQKKYLHELYVLGQNMHFFQFQYDLTDTWQLCLETIKLAAKASQLLEDNEKGIRCALMAAEIHQKIQNEAQIILDLAKKKDRKNIERALKKNELFDGHKQFMLYISILSELILFNEDEPDVGLVKNVMEHMDQNVLNDTSVFNWTEYVPFEYMLLLLKELWNMEVLIEPILKSVELKNIDFDVFDKTDKTKLKLLGSIIVSSTTGYVKGFALIKLSKYFSNLGEEVNAKEMLDIAFETDYKVFNEDDEELKTNVLTELFKEYLKQGHLLMALKPLNKISIDDAGTALGVFGIGLSAAFLKKGEENKATEHLNKIDSKQDKCLAILEWSKIYYQNGDKANSMKMLDVVFESTDNLPNLYAKVEILLELSKVYYQQDDKNMCSEMTDMTFEVCEKIINSGNPYGILLDKVLQDLSSFYLLQGNGSRALKTIEKIDWDYDKDKALIELSNYYIQQGDDIRALATIEKIGQDIYKNPALLELSKYYLHQGNEKKALKMIKPKWLIREALVELFPIYLQLDDKRRCKKIPKMLFDTLNDSVEGDDKNLLLAKLSKTYLQIGEEDNSLKMLNKITDKDCKNKALLELSRVYLQHNNKEKSKELFEIGLGSNIRFSNEDYKNYVLSKLSKGFFQHHDTIKTNRIVEKITDRDVKDKVLLELSKGLIQQDDIRGALKMIKRSENDPFFKDKVLLKLSTYYLQNGKERNAFKTVKKINQQLQSEAILKLSKVYLDQDNIDRANRLNDEKLDGIKKRSFLLYKAMFFLNHGNMEKNKETLDEILTPYELEINDWHPIVETLFPTKLDREKIYLLIEDYEMVTLQELFLAYINRGDDNGAFELADKILHLRGIDKVMMVLSEIYFKKGQTEQAYHAVNKLVDIASKVECIENIINIIEIEKLDSLSHTLYALFNDKRLHVAIYSSYINRIVDQPKDIIQNTNKLLPLVCDDEEMLGKMLYNIAIHEAFINENKYEAKEQLTSLIKYIDIEDWVNNSILN